MKDNPDSAREVIEQLWYRARINALAHKVAAERATSSATWSFRRELSASLGAILSVMLVYFFSTLPQSEGVSRFIFPFTLASIVFTLVALYQGVMSHYRKLDVEAARHEQLLNSFQYLGQRAREVKWLERPSEDIVALLIDLERDFALLKATGKEPSDADFVEAHKIVRKIILDPNTRLAQSFPISLENKNSQQAS
jgi:hypothetical protein